MKNSKKLLSTVLALLLVLALSVGFLAACKDNDTVYQLDNLKLLYERDNDMINTYSMIAVNPNATFGMENAGVFEPATVTRAINTEGADAFINWMSLAATQTLIANYGKAEYNEALFYTLTGAPVSTATVPQATDANKVIKVSTTTSVNDSGLLGYLEPLFETAYGYDIQIASAGTGAAINSAKLGNADLILVHSKSQEDAFVAHASNYARTVAGFSAARISFMYNYFVLIGPKDDPAGVAGKATVKEAFAAIAATEGAQFISRGDASGTHTAEVKLWDSSLGITADTANLPAYAWYVSAGQGMGACLLMANEKKAYVLSDKATFLALANTPVE